MKPRTPDDAPQDDLFRHRLDNIISLKHPLVQLANRIDWDGLNRLLGEYYEDAMVGQPPKATRLMAGLLYLKHTFALSDEELVARWVGTPTGSISAARPISSTNRRCIRPA